MQDCFRESLQVSPFISKDLSLSLEVKKVGVNSYRGVKFTNAEDNISPHISLTHCECALHVLCREVASSLSDTLAAKPSLTGSLSALHIKVPTVNASSFDVSVSESDGVYKAVFGDDTYSLMSESVITVNTFAADRLVTKRSVQEALSKFVTTDIVVLLLDIVGEEECMNNWAFLSNEAMQYIVEDLGVEVVVVNAPSVDRENDGGYVPNHKIIFENRNHLVIELAKLCHLTPSLGNVLLNVEPHNTYADCGASKLQFEPTV